MGYEIEYEGVLECYRRESADVTRLLELIRGSDWLVPLFQADWDWDGLLSRAVGYVLHGSVSWRGEDADDHGTIRLRDSKPC
jgi:hypothetical protein